MMCYCTEMLPSTFHNFLLLTSPEFQKSIVIFINKTESKNRSHTSTQFNTNGPASLVLATLHYVA